MKEESEQSSQTWPTFNAAETTNANGRTSCQVGFRITCKTFLAENLESACLCWFVPSSGMSNVLESTEKGQKEFGAKVLKI